MQGEVKYFLDTFVGSCVEMGSGHERVTLPDELSGLESAVVSDLARVGLLSLDLSDNVPKMRMADENLKLFAPMLAQYRVKLVPMTRQGAPVAFCTALLKECRSQVPAPLELTAPIPAGGQGNRMENAAISCLGELAERLSLCSLGAQDPRVLPFEKEQLEVDFSGLLGLSLTQCRHAAAALRKSGVPIPADVPEWSTLSGRRVALTNLATGRMAQFPSFGVLLREAAWAGAEALSFASSVGCAVWATRHGARERALLELVERDAVAQVWYNRLGITFLEPGLLREILTGTLIDYLDAQPRLWGVYHLESDLPVQVAIAVSHEADGRGCAFGASAGWDVASACEGAIEEMLQSENSLELMTKAYPSGQGQGRMPRQLAYARAGSILEDLPLREALPADERLTARVYGLPELRQALEDQDITVWEFDATRPDLNIPCVKLLSPQLCTWEPRFGKRRLFQGVVDRGLRQHPATEAEFAARPFPF
ncbi:YcaO-like family protein [Roseibium sediminicola]|uniref:YcaO-like family protein n=1 Tax=Roseibium sediminicola TaxID=2933272 RepID=A0ABT0H2K4_9HYPH|nr:YcaO-like family protein [Roseibium sp. CAU 1639]MCK7615918.1 YcaO-like family protein [Roseibium sp. CAU 1639]